MNIAIVPAADTIETKRLLLRRFRTTDASEMHGIMSDLEAMRFWSTLPHATLADTEAWIARTIAGVASGESDDFVVLEADRVVGKAGLWRDAELGVLFARSAWGRGIAREAAAAIIARARQRGIIRITADVDPRNQRALKFLAHLGFVKTGEAARTFRLGDDWADSVYLALKL